MKDCSARSAYFVDSNCVTAYRLHYVSIGVEGRHRWVKSEASLVGSHSREKRKVLKPGRVDVRRYEG